MMSFGLDAARRLSVTARCHLVSGVLPGRYWLNFLSGMEGSMAEALIGCVGDSAILVLLLGGLMQGGYRPSMPSRLASRGRDGGCELNSCRYRHLVQVDGTSLSIRCDDAPVPGRVRQGAGR